MNLINACSNILQQLTFVINQVSPADFSKPSTALSQSTIGQHLRHTLEFFECFEKGYATGKINYDERDHDKILETDKAVALLALEDITRFIQNLNEDRPLSLAVNYDLNKDIFETLTTTAKRELVYNIEHAVHHMALIKIGIREVAPYVTLPADFGIAASTIRFNEAKTVASH